MNAPLPDNEIERLRALHDCNIRNTSEDAGFSQITQLASLIFNAPIAAVSLVDGCQQGFKAILGLPASETPRNAAFCAHTILQESPLVVADARLDPRFSDNPLVTGSPHIRFYAGSPIVSSDGFRIGSLCVVDTVARTVTDDQVRALEMLSSQVGALIELGRRISMQDQLIAERDLANARLLESDARSREAQQIANLGSWELDVLTGDLHWSEHLYHILDFDIEDGTPHYDQIRSRFYPDDRATSDLAVERAIADGQPYQFDLRVVHRDGSIRWTVSNGHPVTDDAGRVVKITGTVMDISDRKYAEQEALRLAAIVESTHDGILAVTVDGTLVGWNKGAERIYGFAEHEAIGRDASFLHPQGDPRFARETMAAIKRGEARENIEVTRVRKDGSEIFVSLTFSPIRNSDGEMVGMAAIARDITEQKLAEQALIDSERRLVEAQRVANVGSWEIELLTGKITWSAEMYRIFDYNPLLAIEIESLLAKLHPDDLDTRNNVVEEAIKTGTPYEYDFRLVLDDGSVRWCHSIGQPTCNQSGEITHIVGTVLDITARKATEEDLRNYGVALEFQRSELKSALVTLEEANQRLSALSVEDALTGLKNHRAFQERIATEVNRAERYGTPLSLVILDVDNFKQFNDTYGHPKGDEVLKTVGRLLAEVVRESDMAARYGGEEFALILPQTDEAGALIIAERARAAVAEWCWQYRAVTVSLGVCTLGLRANDKQSLVAAADQALYHSKRAGRNRVTVSHAPTTSFAVAVSQVG